MPEVVVYRSNAAIMATGAQASEAARVVLPPKAEDIPLDRSANYLAAALLGEAFGASSDIRPDFGFVAATGRGVPDTMGAAGPTQFLLTLNSVVRSFNKNTGQPDGVLDLSLQGFFGAAGLNVCCDPKVRFDRLSGRWFVGAFAGQNIQLAVSDGATLTPASGWRFFSIRQDLVPPAGEAGCRPDYTRMAVDEHAVYFVFAMFNAQLTAACPGNPFGISAFVIRKASVLGAGPPFATAFRGAGRLHIPVDQYETGSSVGYITTSMSIGPNSLTQRSFYRVLDPGGTPTLSAEIAYAPGTPGPARPVRHLGNVRETGNPDDDSGRMFLATSQSHAVPLRRGRIWVGELLYVDNTGRQVWNIPQTRNGLGFLEIRDIEGSAPSTVQSGVLFTPSATNDVNQRNYWMPALMVNGQGHLVVAGSAAGTNEYINAAVAGRLATDPPGTFRPPTLLTQATAAYNATSTFSGGTYRWGDYSNASLDPTDDMTMWVVQQFAVGGDVWGVVVARIRAPGPPPALTAAPAAITANSASLAVNVTGTPTDGEGFYDPGPGFSGRLQATIDGGVRVNRVTYVSPTSLTLDVSTQCAANGPHALSIVNPDGQRVTVPAALTTNLTPQPVRTAPAAPALSGVAGTDSVTLTWAAASGCEPASFTLEAGSAPGTSDLYVGSLGTATSFAASVPRGIYYVRVRGVNDIGMGPASNELTLTVGTSVPPGSPSGLTGTVSGQNVSLTWQPPTVGGGVQAYVLEAGSAPGFANVATLALPPGSPAFQTAGVPPGTYYVRARAQNEGGISAPSNEATLVVRLPTPGTPTNLIGSVTAGRTVTLTWNAPASGDTVTGYRLEAGSDTGLTNLAAMTLAAGATGFATSGVPPGRYFVRVRALSGGVVGTPSNEVVVVVP